MVRYYRIAGIDIAIDAQALPENEGTLRPFRTAQAKDPHVFEYRKTEKLDPPAAPLLYADPALRVYGDGNGEQRFIGTVNDSWELAYLRGDHLGKMHRIQVKMSLFPGDIGIKTIQNSLILEHLAVQNRGFILHASYILWDGKAILFTAPSGTGKSTQARLWEQLRGAELINGDRAIVRLEDSTVMACGLPFCGSSQTCKNVTAPLAAIVFLGQSEKTTIRRLPGVQAFRRVWEGCSVNTWNREDVAMAINTVQKAIGSVPVLFLSCTPDESAVTALEQALRE